MSDTPFQEYPKWVGDRKDGNRIVINNKKEEDEFNASSKPEAAQGQLAGWDTKPAKK